MPKRPDENQGSLFDVTPAPTLDPRPRVSDDDPGPPPPPVPPFEAIRETMTSPIGMHPLLPEVVTDGPRGGETYDETQDRARLANQQAAVLRAISDHEWHTLAWLAGQVGAPQSSVSARLRDLRKPAYGSRVIDRRRVEGGNGLHEYRLDPDKRQPEPVPDRTLAHVVQLVSEVPDDFTAPPLVVLLCRQCSWRYELPEGSTVQNAHDALARHPRKETP